MAVSRFGGIYPEGNRQTLVVKQHSEKQIAPMTRVQLSSHIHAENVCITQVETKWCGMAGVIRSFLLASHPHLLKASLCLAGTRLPVLSDAALSGMESRAGTSSGCAVYCLHSRPSLPPLGRPDECLDARVTSSLFLCPFPGYESKGEMRQALEDTFLAISPFPQIVVRNGPLSRETTKEEEVWRGTNRYLSTSPRFPVLVVRRRSATPSTAMFQV